MNCGYETCNHSYASYNNLLRHYRENPSHAHKVYNLKGRGRPKESSADDIISTVINEKLPPQTRSSQVKSFVSSLTLQELKTYCLPKLVKSVQPWEYIVESSKTSQGIQTSYISLHFVNTRNYLALKYPELVGILFVNNTPPAHRENIISQDELTKLLNQNKHLVCDWLAKSETIFKGILMPIIYKLNKAVFLDFACGVVGSLCVSQKITQDILRNTWGKKLEQVLGINIFPPKDTIVNTLNSKRSMSTVKRK